MKIDSENRIRYGGAWIREHKDWLKKHPLGPVHWDVWNTDKSAILATEIAAGGLPSFLESVGLLIRW